MPGYSLLRIVLIILAVLAALAVLVGAATSIDPANLDAVAILLLAGAVVVP